jgi:bifunctional DNA-binding transcriptional regulator/antitoxin component of YhaV-PrlF toxin-antitoxin module
MTPHGPHRIAKNGQVVIPKDVLREAGLVPGDQVFLQALDHPMGAIMVLPAPLAAEWFEAGKASDM